MLTRTMGMSRAWMMMAASVALLAVALGGATIATVAAGSVTEPADQLHWSLLESSTSQWAELVDQLEDEDRADLLAFLQTAVQTDAEAEAAEAAHFTQLQGESAAPTKAAAPKAKAKAKATKTKAKTAKAVRAKRRPAAERLSSAEQRTKFNRFLVTNGKKYKTTAAAEQAFAAFQKNRESIVKLNDKMEGRREPVEFRSSGPFGDLSNEQFRQKLKVRPPTAASNVAVPAKSSSKAKAAKATGTKTAKVSAKKSNTKAASAKKSSNKAAKSPAASKAAKSTAAKAAKATKVPKASKAGKVTKVAKATKATKTAKASKSGSAKASSKAASNSAAKAIKSNKAKAIKAAKPKTAVKATKATKATKAKVAVKAAKPQKAKKTGGKAAAFLQLDAELLADADADVDADADLDADSEAEAEDDLMAALEMDASPKKGAGGAVGAGGGAVGAGGGAVGAGGGAVGAGGGAVGAGGGAVGAGGGAVGAGGGAVGAGGGAVGAGGGAVGAGGGAVGAGGGAVGAGGGAVGAGGGAVGKSGGIIVEPIVLSGVGAFKPYNPLSDPRDRTPADRMCRLFYSIFVMKVGKVGKFFQNGFQKDEEKAMDNLCNGYKTTGLTGFMAKFIFPLFNDPMTETLRDAIEEINRHESGTSFTNPHIDLREAPNSQAQCGSCWAQAAIGSFEVALKKAKKYTEPLSVQQLLDCVNIGQSNGCEGGTPMDALAWLQKNGAATEREYPYTGVKGKCDTRWGKDGPKSSGYKQTVTPCLKGDCKESLKYELNLMLAVKEKGPFMVYVDAKNWQNYGGGIFPPEQCSSSNEAGNHVVQLLGYGHSDGVAYWLLKNSWGKTWGEDGYIRLPMGINACGVANFVGQA